MNDTRREYDANGDFVDVPLTNIEQAARDAEKAAMAAVQTQMHIKNQIQELEALQTPRRLREAFTDPAWLNNLNAQIATLRAQLK